MPNLYFEECQRLLEFLGELSSDPLSLPGQDDLAMLLDVAFWASLEKEEGRPTRFVLVYQDAPTSDDPASLCLERPLEFSVHNLVKLAPAMVPEQRALGVARDGKGVLVIWGSLSLPSGALTIGADEAGKLQVRFGDRTRVVARGGQLTYLANDNSESLLFLIKAVSEYPLLVTPWFLVLSAALERVIQAVLRQGHGGCVLWVPADCDWSSGVKSIRFPCTPYLGLSRELQALFPEARAIAADQEEELSQRLTFVHPTLQSVGQLTGVDGAMVINEDLHVLAFGVMLRSESSDAHQPVRIFELGQLSATAGRRGPLPEVPLSQLGGARHRSAAEFCSRFPRSLAFVASQDGSLTIFGCIATTDQLFAIRRAELAFQ